MHGTDVLAVKKCTPLKLTLVVVGALLDLLVETVGALLDFVETLVVVQIVGVRLDLLPPVALVVVGALLDLLLLLLPLVDLDALDPVGDDFDWRWRIFFPDHSLTTTSSLSTFPSTIASSFLIKVLRRSSSAL